MGLQHFILPFSVLAIGLVLSTLVWTLEMNIKHCGKSGGAAIALEAVDNEAEFEEVKIVDVDANDIEDDNDDVDEDVVGV